MKHLIIETVELEPSDAGIRAAIALVGVREVARKFNISPSMLSRWVRGKCPMTVEKVERVLDLINQRIPRKLPRRLESPARMAEVRE